MSTSVIASEPLRPDELPLAEYRQVSRAAIAALGLGIASALVLVTPLLVPVAAAAIVVAVFALRSISASKGQVVGGSVAIAGLCLATLFMGWSFARHFTRQSTLVGHARQTAEAWLQLVQAGKLKEALQFRQTSAVRITTPGALDEHYAKNSEAAQELKGFATNGGVKELVASPQAKVQFEGLVSAVHEGFSDRIVLKYVFDKSAGGQQPLWIHVTRLTDEKTKASDWQITATDINPPPGTL